MTFETHVPGADDLTVQAMESWFEETEINRHWLPFFVTVCDEFFEFAGKFDVKEKKASAFFLVSINLQTSYNLTTTLRSLCSIVFFVPSTGRSIPKVLWASAIA